MEPEMVEVYPPVALQQVLLSINEEQISKEPPLQVTVVEDLSREVIEMLGSRFKMDHLFFREQIEVHTWLSIRDPRATTPNLIANSKRRNWFCVRNVRLRYFSSREQFEGSWLESNQFNVVRRPFADGSSSFVSIIQTRTTIWIGKDPVYNERACRYRSS